MALDVVSATAVGGGGEHEGWWWIYGCGGSISEYRRCRCLFPIPKASRNFPPPGLLSTLKQRPAVAETSVRTEEVVEYKVSKPYRQGRWKKEERNVD